MKELSIETRDGYKNSVLWYEAQKENAPLLIEIHGGGFMSGTNKKEKRICEEINQRLDINVASFNYRLAPKFKFPTATYDCFDSLKGLMVDESLNFDRNRIFLMGYSAGGSIAAGIVYMLLKEGVKTKGLILNYPFLDAAIKPRSRKYVRFSMPSIYMSYMNRVYYPDKKQRTLPLASPVLIEKEELKKFPKTLIITSFHDSLKYDGIKFKKAMDEAGASCELFEFEKTMHGFLEVVCRNSSFLEWWWGTPKLRRIQKQSYLDAMEKIIKFIADVLPLKYEH